MSSNYVCAKCGKPWEVGTQECQFCGFDQNQMVRATAYRPLPSTASNYEPEVSQTPYVVVTVIGGALMGLLVYLTVRDVANGAFVYGLVAGLITAANIWLCCLIYITKAKVDRLGRVLDDVSRRVP